jgi:signal transduction histidine kinase
MTRTWVWLQIMIGWLPVWVLFTMMIVTAHNAPVPYAALEALRMMVAAAVLGIFVHRFTGRLPWPYPMQVRFVLLHLVAAGVYAVAWLGTISAIESAVQSVHHGGFVLAFVIGPGVVPFLTLGIWLYVMIAGVTYGNRAAQRAARIEALAARTQLAALRAQLHPHFLFNALHTVVQLIPVDPKGATRAAEQLAGVLRTAIEEDRDLVTLGEELAFVRRYLTIEGIRFGERLRVHEAIADDALIALVPSFALQTLVENAVRHGAAPRVEATNLSITARIDGEALVVGVADDGAGAGQATLDAATGTGLRRLRERLKHLYGVRAALAIDASAGKGFRATLTLPIGVEPVAALGYGHGH